MSAVTEVSIKSRELAVFARLAKDASDQAAVLAVNDTLPFARRLASVEIREQVNFTASYLGPNSGRLSIIRRASSSQVEGVIRGRNRATSLARFSTSPQVFGSRKGRRAILV